MSQRLWKLTQPTDDWLPADHDARMRNQHQQQQQMTTMMTSPVGLVGFRPRPCDDVTDHVTADKDGRHANSAFDDDIFVITPCSYSSEPVSH